VTKTLEYFKYALYIRLGLECQQILLLSSAVEIRIHDFSHSSSIISFCFSIIGLLIGLSVTFIALGVFINNWRNHDPDKKFVFMEMLADIRDSRIARLYAFMLLARRTLFVLITVFLAGEINRIITYVFLIGIQLCYILFVVSLHLLIHLDYHSPIQ
jgi:hypothetical protein